MTVHTNRLYERQVRPVETNPLFREEGEVLSPREFRRLECYLSGNNDTAGIPDGSTVHRNFLYERRVRSVETNPLFREEDEVLSPPEPPVLRPTEPPVLRPTEPPVLRPPEPVVLRPNYTSQDEATAFFKVQREYEKLQKKLAKQSQRQLFVSVEDANDDASEQRSTMDNVISMFDQFYDIVRSITPEYFLEANEIDYGCVCLSDDEDQQSSFIGMFLVGGVVCVGVSYGCSFLYGQWKQRYGQKDS